MFLPKRKPKIKTAWKETLGFLRWGKIMREKSPGVFPFEGNPGYFDTEKNQK